MYQSYELSWTCSGTNILLKSYGFDHVNAVRLEKMCVYVYYRAELDCKVEEVRHEMESRLDSQRRHMVQKESLLRSEVDELKV